MADVNLTQEEFLTYEGLGYFKQKQDALNDQKNAKVLKDAKDYFDDRVDEFDPAGTGATEAGKVQTELDKEVTRAKAREDEIAGLVATAQNEVDALELVVDTKANASDLTALSNKVGTVPEGSTVMEIIENIQENAYDDTELKTEINTELAKKADKAQVATDIADAVKVEEDARKESVSGVQGAIDTLAETHATDKATLEGAIALKADKTALDEVSEVANAAVKQTNYDAKVAALEAEDARIASLVSSEAERAAGVEESLQTQINTITNNPDTEGVINSINEFTQYITEHGEIAEGFRTDIDANAQAIEDLSTEVAQTYETKEDATAKYDELMAEVAAKAVQADWNQNDPAAADYVKNRTHYEDVSYTVILEEMEITTSESRWGDDIIASEELDDKLSTRPDYANGENLLITLNGESYELRFEQVERYDYAAGNAYLFRVNGQTDDGTDFAFHSGTDQQYKLVTREPGTYTLKIVSLDRATTTVAKQLDEKYIPDTIARVADLTELDERITAAVTTKVEQSAYDEKVTALEGEDTAIKGRLDVIEGQLGDGEGSVADMIDDAKQEAIDVASADATAKANQAETNAKAEVTALANGAVKTNTDAIADNAQAIADIQAAMPTPITTAKIDELFATV